MKSVVVTGASSGIGYKICVDLIELKGTTHPWKVFGLARRKEILNKMASDWGDSFVPVVCDLSNENSIQRAVSEISEKTDSLEGLVNNAGIFRPGSITEDNDENWWAHFTVNLMGPVRLTRALWPLLKKAPQSSVVNISSTLGERPIPGTGSYSALKGALNNWTSTLALEGASFGIRANAVSPGIVDTPIHSFHQSPEAEDLERKKSSQKLQPLQRIGQPKDISPMVCHLLSDASEWTTGANINIDGGILLNS